MRCILILATIVIAACAAPTSKRAKSAEAAAGAPWPGFVDQVIEAYFAQNPSFGVAVGRHEYDGQLPDWSPAGIQKHVVWLEQTQKRASDFDDGSLSVTERFQLEYLRSRIDSELFIMRDLRAPFTSPVYYFGSGLDPSTYVTRPYAPVEQRAKAFVLYLRQIPGALAQLKKNLELPLPKTFVDFSVAGFQGFASFYETDALAAFASATDPKLQEELRVAVAPAAKAMRDLGDWFAAQQTFSERGYVLGEGRFRAMLLATERVTTPLEELEAIGRADMDRNHAALARACERYLPGAPIEKCIEKTNEDKPAGGAVEGAAAQLAQLRAFVASRDLVSIPGSEEAKVAEAPPYARQNFAYIEIPGPYEKHLPSVYYIAPPDPKWTAAEQAAYVPGKAELLFTSVHEVWPGHFLQFMHSNRSAWRFGQLFSTYAFGEGWAHYAEELMVERGLAEHAPDLEIGQLSNALLRNVRYLCAIGLHARNMTVAQCEQLFKDKGYQDAGNARQQAARGTYDPGYLNYTMGKLMIRKLRADWQAENPGRPLREFHDALLAHGSPPLPLLRSQLLKAPNSAVF